MKILFSWKKIVVLINKKTPMIPTTLKTHLYLPSNNKLQYSKIQI